MVCRSLRRRRLRVTTALACACGYLAFSNFAEAAETWSGNNSTDWFTSGNWSTTVPTSSDNVTIDTITPNPTVVGAPGAQAADVSVGFTGNGDLTINGGGSLSAANGYIGGGATGSVTVDGAGSLWTLSAALYVSQSSTGTLTVVNGGAVNVGTTLSVGASGTINIGAASGQAAAAPGTLSATGISVQSGGLIVFNHTSSNYTFATPISGGGSVEADAGTTIFTGANTYSGGTTISAGTLQVGAGGTTGWITGNVTNNGTLAFDRSDAVTFGGVISGTGAVQHNGTGTTILTETNTYFGGTTISAGTLQIGAGGTTGWITGNVTNNGTFAFDRSDAVTFGGAISGTGALQQNGTGNLILSNTNAYSGATTVNAGTLSVNGSIASSAVTINSGGTLGGNGTVGSTTIASGGTLAPGNSIGTITVNGNLTFNSGSTYHIEVSPAAADHTNVTGSATLAGTVHATYTPGFYATKRYTIINAAGGVSGTFSALTSTNLPSNLSATLLYDANNAYLNLALNFALTYPNLNRNQSNVGTALSDYLKDTGSIPSVFVNLTADGLRQVSGEVGSSQLVPMFNGSNQFVDTVFNRAFENDFDGGTPAFAAAVHEAVLGYAAPSRLSREAAEAYAAMTPAEVIPYNPVVARWHTWASIYDGSGRVSGNAAVGSSPTTSRADGFAAGANYRMTPDTIVGFAVGGADTHFSLDNGLGSGKADVFNAALYSRHRFGQAYVAGLLSLGWHNVSTDRTVTINEIDTLHADFRAYSYVGRAEVGYRIGGPLLDMTPYGAIQVTTFRLPAYSETATSGTDQFALSYSSRLPTTTRTELGLRLAKVLPTPNGAMKLNGRLAWARDSVSEAGATATFQSLPGATFTVNGATPAPDGVLVSAGFDYYLGYGWSIAANFDGEFSGTTAIYTEKATIRNHW